MQGKYYKPLLDIIPYFIQNNIPEKGYTRVVFFIFATDKVYNTLSEEFECQIISK